MSIMDFRQSRALVMVCLLESRHLDERRTVCQYRLLDSECEATATPLNTGSGIMYESIVVEGSMKKRSIGELMKTPVDFVNDTDEELLSRFNMNYRIYKDIPVARMQPRLIDAVIRGQIFDFADKVPKTLWTTYFIECTVMVKEMRHLMDPSLVTSEMIDDMCIFGYECLKVLPHDKHPYHQACLLYTSDAADE